MKYLAAFVLSLTALAALAFVPASAGPACGAPVVVRKQAVVRTQAVVAAPAVVAQNVVVAQFVAVPVVVPTFAVGYDPNSYGVAEELRAIREELRKTREALTAPPGVREPEVQPSAGPMEPLTPRAEVPPHVQVLSHHCAACHTGARSKGGCVIFSAPGELAPGVNRLALWDAAESRAMPPDPKPKVHPDDVKVLLEWARAKK